MGFLAWLDYDRDRANGAAVPVTLWTHHLAELWWLFAGSESSLILYIYCIGRGIGEGVD